MELLGSTDRIGCAGACGKTDPSGRGEEPKTEGNWGFDGTPLPTCRESDAGFGGIAGFGG